MADSAFPLTEYLMKPFGGSNLNKKKKIYNYRYICNLKFDFNPNILSISRGRRLIENTFGLAAVRWRLLYKAIELNIENAISCVMAIVVLHNFLIEELPPNYSITRWADIGDVDNGIWRADADLQFNPLVQAQIQRPYANNKHKKSAEEMREKLIHYFNYVYPVPWQD